ncbi:MAG: hypothetical protein KF875_15030 [Trueperaceae bacterium]|nr:hypothetical protein [Trueperaceae bacterium]MCO5173052.1 hypothetical protein [Trueperaceae bacterium]MCO5175345.1 hypothetical protein [Trueperaceae bacterium]MCW5820815.1 hypothetical protein [Trueperaceae bacterium]
MSSKTRASLEPAVSYRICPVCARATPSSAGENYCPNDGAELLRACPSCGAPIGSPFGEYCSACGGRLFAHEGREPQRH